MSDDFTTINAVADIFDGPHATPNKTGDGPFFLNIASLQNGRLVLADSAHLSDEDFVRWTKRVTPGENDLLFSYETRLGEAALMPAGIKACLGRRMGLLRPRLDKVDPEFLLYSYLSPHFQQEIVANTITGATVDRISVSEIGKFKIRIPALAEQQKIAAVLSALDAKIDLNNRINAELEALAKTIYDYWFVQFDFPDAKGRPYKSSGGKMFWNEALNREIPAGWEATDITSVAAVLGGATPSKSNPDNWSGDIPFFTPTDAGGCVFQLETEDSITHTGLDSCSSDLFDKGTIFITARGSVGKLAIAGRAMAMNQSCYALVPKVPANYPFVFLHAKTLIHHLKVKASGSTFNSIVTNDIEWTKLITPKPKVVSAFCKVVAPLFERIEAAQCENLELTQLRDWLLPLLMNGQVRVA